jgi:hypothetical protein
MRYPGIWLSSIISVWASFWAMGALKRRFSRTLNLLISHPIFSADQPVFPGFSEA